MEIRKGTLDDVNDISRIHALSWKSAYKGIVPQKYLDELKEDFWVHTFTSWLQDNTVAVMVIIDDERPVGVAVCGRSRDKALPDWGEIVSIYLLPEYINRGYGSSLFESVLQDMKQSGYRDTYLWVLKDNQRARRFYEKKGFHCSKDEYTIKILDKELVDVRYIYCNSTNTRP